MLGKTMSGKPHHFTVAAVIVGTLWLAACSPAAATGTSEPQAQATTAITAADTTPVATTATSEPTAGTAPAAVTESSTVTESVAVTESGTNTESETSGATFAKLNLNTATSEQFLTIPNVGDRMVNEFEEYRPYVSIQEFRQEIGKYVDEAQVAAYEEYVYVPVVPNSSDAETLQQLPGVTPEVADALMAGRPYQSNAAFLDALSQTVTPEELAIGEHYLESE
jgi:DNA uptake protein ComE-like DNA-binding protein